MPDLDILIQIAAYYNVEIREILDGERKSEKVNKDLEETVLKVADYNNEEIKRITKMSCLINHPFTTPTVLRRFTGTTKSDWFFITVSMSL